MLFSVPIFTESTYLEDPDPYTVGLKYMALYKVDTVEFEVAQEVFWDEMRSLRTPIISLYFKGKSTKGQVIEFTRDSNTNPADLRTAEKELVSIGGDFYDYTGVAIYDLRSNSQLQAGLGIGTTLFVCIVLASGALTFSSLTSNLVILPIEKMIEKVNRIAQNPLEAAQEEEAEALALDKIREEEKEFELKHGKKKHTKKKEEFETVILEQTIAKIGALLALGFGEAGSKIIAENMSRGSGDVDPMIPGQRINAIFGFCDIRRFTDTTEVLREGVMLFTNEVGEIVHGITNQFSGAANKNIGDAFLLVWKFTECENH
jgi:hypothetical protein